MAPSADDTICATPLLPSPRCVSAGKAVSLAAPNFQASPAVGPAAASKNLVKFCVVPDASARTATTMSVAGSVTPGLSAAMIGSFHFVISRWKIAEMLVAESCNLATLGRLYDIVIGA